MTNPIDRSSDRPAYKQLADFYREQILSGQVAAGTELPSEAELMAALAVSRNTIRQAWRILAAEGLIVTGRGQRNRVRPIRVIGSQRYELGKDNYGNEASSFAREHGVPWSEFDVDREYRIVPAPPRVASALLMNVGDDVYERQFTHATGGVVLRVSRSYLSAARFANTILTDPAAEMWPGGTVAQLLACGHDVTRVRTEVTARAASQREADGLMVPPGSPVLEAWRIQFAGDDPVETAQHVYPPTGQLLVFDIPVHAGRKAGEWSEWSGPAYDG